MEAKHFGKYHNIQVGHDDCISNGIHPLPNYPLLVDFGTLIHGANFVWLHLSKVKIDYNPHLDIDCTLVDVDCVEVPVQA